MTPPFFTTYPRACAVILASSKGSRLFPITTTERPKHLLPVAGVPSILRLLRRQGPLSAFPQVVITIAADDTQTISTLVGEKDGVQEAAGGNKVDKPPLEHAEPLATLQSDNHASSWKFVSNQVQGQVIHVIKLSEDCFGPIDALRQVEATKTVDARTRIVVLPGDLVFLKESNGNGSTNVLDPLIRPSSNGACISMLVDVLEQDEHGNALKESAKARIGGLSRDEEDIEYIALSFPSKSWVENSYTTNERLPQIILKKSKSEIEADEDMTGSTAKLQIPKARLRQGEVVIRTEWSDVHVYSFAPWVRQLIVSRTKNLSSIQEDLLPLLIARQHRGKRATFGKAGLEVLAEWTKENIDEENRGDFSSLSYPSHSPTNTQNDALPTGQDDEPYVVQALILPSKSALRANSIAAYLFACKEAVSTSDTSLPKGSRWNGKFQTLTLPGATLGTKITMKSTTVGANCQLGDKCRLNNVVIMDNAIIGEGCSLQNTIIGHGAKVGNNCSLSDCQVGPGMEIPSSTKEKGEMFMVGDVMEEEIML
ncbi:mannose-1-phosphate guanylyltransferase [Nitzschia inconspicua]|uniref:Mannose-1-phosphate guanylyltransferase n=1 Tax=Nitzschia inconspicua TaxID=303405 RepID=A0A9K3KRV2_9STRA|nr:mannose-1-phosphate guanylyltransferase [Nitzschia inconspicua]